MIASRQLALWLLDAHDRGLTWLTVQPEGILEGVLVGLILVQHLGHGSYWASTAFRLATAPDSGGA
ncbi:MAG: hypothetical protein RML36_09385 [Anaerolineae bacterium]|nr:hypothetical protein [Anaerolineae bacterium]